MANILIAPAVEVSLGNLTDALSFEVSLGSIYIGTNHYPRYDGEYVFTPTQEEQIVPTAHTSLDNNIVINPIPKNYGLVTWNGSIMTIT